MQSWSLKVFIREFGVHEAARVLGFTNAKSIYRSALDRDIQIVQPDDGFIEAHETKLLNRVKYKQIEGK